MQTPEIIEGFLKKTYTILKEITTGVGMPTKTFQGRNANGELCHIQVTSTDDDTMGLPWDSIRSSKVDE